MIRGCLARSGSSLADLDGCDLLLGASDDFNSLFSGIGRDEVVRDVHVFSDRIFGPG